MEPSRAACASSPITVLITQVGSVGAEPDADLLAVLAGVPDPRKARGRRHRLVTALAVGVAAVLAGARSYVAIEAMADEAERGYDVEEILLRRSRPAGDGVGRVLGRVGAIGSGAQA